MLVRVREEEEGATRYCMSPGWPCLIFLMLITSYCLRCSGDVEMGRGVSEGCLDQPASAQASMLLTSHCH